MIRCKPSASNSARRSAGTRIRALGATPVRPRRATRGHIETSDDVKGMGGTPASRIRGRRHYAAGPGRAKGPADKSSSRLRPCLYPTSPPVCYDGCDPTHFRSA